MPASTLVKLKVKAAGAAARAGLSGFRTQVLVEVLAGYTGMFDIDNILVTLCRLV